MKLYEEILKCYEGETEEHANTSFVTETNPNTWAGVISSIKSRKTHTNIWAFQRYVRPIVPVKKLVHKYDPNTQRSKRKPNNG